MADLSKRLKSSLLDISRTHNDTGERRETRLGKELVEFFIVKCKDEGYSRKDENGNIVSLEEYEAAYRPTGISKFITPAEAKLLAICGVGFFIDAYDLFIINLVIPIWQFYYWGGLQGVKKPTYPLLLRGAVNAGANIGNVIGQVLFGFLGDALGRKFVYGKEMIVVIVGIIFLIALPNSIRPTYDKFWWLFGFRILMGIGVGGATPIVAERSTLKNRGRMLGFIFSNQGWGTVAASLVALILLGCFSSALKAGEYGQLNAIWRLQIGFSLVPSFAVLYFRLTMPESRKFLQSSELSSVAASSMVSSSNTLDSEQIVKDQPKLADGNELSEKDGKVSVVEAYAVPPSNATKYRVFLQYFSEWRHLRALIGTASTWFFVDVAFYGLNLNQSVILKDINFSTGATEYETLLKGTYGNLIIAVAGHLPGYFITIALIETLGCKWIQIQGFLVTSLTFIIIAADYKGLGTGGKFACFTIAQLFFNFGPNATTFIVPAEAFPSRVRGLAHGVSAATGKVGAILFGVLSNYLASSDNPNGIGVANVLWIFVACGLLGAIMTFFFVPETTGIDADDVDYRELQEKASRGKFDGSMFDFAHEAKSMMWWKYNK